MPEASPTLHKVSLADAFSRFEERWSPRIVAELNGQQVKVAKVEGEFDWHHHQEEDELFWVVSGHLTLEIRRPDGTPAPAIELDPGELAVIPRGVEHRPVARAETHIVLFEPASTLNTGNVRTEKTVDRPERLTP